MYLVIDDNCGRTIYLGSNLADAFSIMIIHSRKLQDNDMGVHVYRELEQESLGLFCNKCGIPIPIERGRCRCCCHGCGSMGSVGERMSPDKERVDDFTNVKFDPKYLVQSNNGYYFRAKCDCSCRSCNCICHNKQVDDPDIGEDAVTLYKKYRSEYSPSITDSETDSENENDDL